MLKTACLKEARRTIESFLEKNEVKLLFKLISFIGVFILLYILYYLTINNMSITLSSVGVLITIYVAIMQSPQINRLTNIAGETKAITETLGTNAIKEKNVKNFFPRKDDKKYKLFYPVDNEGRTLPLINEADSYATHVISDLLGVNYLELRPVARYDEMCDASLDDVGKGNAIILCDVNPALKRFESEYKDMKDLPCWFEECDSVIDVLKKYNKGKTIKIAVRSTEKHGSDEYTSPSEQCCIDATESINKKYKPEETFQKDYGILARLSNDEFKYIIIAGIHGYGTWITASYLNHLLWKGSKNYNNLYFGENDFVAIIKGEFDTMNLFSDVESMRVVDIWQKDARGWTKFLSEK